MTTNPEALGVWLEGRHVGTIMHLPPEKGDMSIFLFDADYQKDLDRPILSLSFLGGQNSIVYQPRYFNMRVHPFFANLLPEGKLRDYIAGNQGVNAKRDFFLLRALGADLPGGVVILPEESGLTGLTGADHERYDGHTGVYQEGEPLKFSLAGVQIKMSAVQNAKGGMTIPAYGRGGSWIIKLPSMHFDAVPENEFTMMRLADRVGLPVPETHLLPMSEVEGLPTGMRRSESLFAIRRFDRGAQGERIHMEDFAQVFGQYQDQKYHKASYQNIAKVLLQMGGVTEIQDFMRRIVFMAATGNGDMHLKNWSLLYRDGRKPTLSPVYDMLSTLPYVSLSHREAMGLSFSGSKAFHEFSSARIRRFAEKLEIDSDVLLTTAKNMAEIIPDAWQDWKRDAPMPKAMQQMVDEHMRNIPLFREVHPRWQTFGTLDGDT